MEKGGNDNVRLSGTYGSYRQDEMVDKHKNSGSTVPNVYNSNSKRGIFDYGATKERCCGHSML